MPRVLIVDDDADVRELVETVLTGQGHGVDGADGGRAALERLTLEAYDLVVCDLHMPDVDGADVYRAMQGLPAPRPVVLFLSGFHDAPRYEPFLRETRTPVLAKPFDVNALRGAVRRVLRRT